MYLYIIICFVIVIFVVVNCFYVLSYMCLLVSMYVCFGEHVYRLSFCVTLSIDNNNNSST